MSNNDLGSNLSVSERLRYELRKLYKYYGVIKCFIIEGNELNKIDCGDLSKYVIEGKLIKTLRICNERLGNVCVEANMGEKVITLEVVGKEVYFMLEEGSHVKRGQRIAYVLTGKGELRAVKSPVNGFVLFYDEILGEKPYKYRIFLVVRNEIG